MSVASTVTTTHQPTGEDASISYSTKADVDIKVSALRETFRSGRAKDVRFRIWQLKQLYWMITDNHSAIVEVLRQDLGRHEYESCLSDINSLKDEIRHHVDHVHTWVRDEVPDSGFFFTRVGSTYIRQEPRGVVFIIGPWNFPFSLLLHPLASAIAAGCTALLKPSEVAAHSAALIVRLLPAYLDTSAYAVVTGSAQETQYMLAQKFDHIFFTGSTPVARHVAAAAARHLTPTVLELGGQGPAIVTKSANIVISTKRIVAAKFMNAGQICLSVNHVFVDPAIHQEFVARVQTPSQAIQAI